MKHSDFQRSESQPLWREEPEETIDLSRLWSRFRRRLPVFAFAFCVTVVAALVAIATTPPKFTATASVLMDQRNPGILKPAEDRTAADQDRIDSGAVDTQVEIIRSRAVAHRVVDRLGLIRDPEFNAELRGKSPLSRVKGLLHGLAYGATTGAVVVADDPREPVTDAVLGRLKVNRVGTTYILNISATTDAPLKAREIANGFAQDYLAAQVGTAVEEDKSRDQSLQSRINDLRGQVEVAETAVEQYKIDHNLLSAQGQTLTEQEASALDQQLNLSLAQQSEAEARVSTARSQLARGSHGDDVGEALNSPVVQQLRQQRAQASQKVADLASRYGERYPALVSARHDLADVDSQIQTEIHRVISNLQAQAQVARQRTASVQAGVDRTRAALAGNDRSSVRLNELQRNLDSAKSLYETLLNRYHETNTQQEMEQSEARIISPAQTPTGPSGPSKMMGSLVAFVLGGLAGLIAAVVADILDTSFSTADDLRRKTGLACFASLPTLSSTLPAKSPATPNVIDYVVEEPLSVFAESFRSLRTSLAFAKSRRPVSVVAVTSSLPGEGKSTAVMCLGRSSAMAGISTVILDCDLRRRTVSQAVAPKASVGLVEVLDGTARLEDALFVDPDSGMCLLPLASAKAIRSDIFDKARTQALLEALRERFKLILLDTAPVLPIADTRALAAQADGVLLLVRWRKTPAKAVSSAVAMLNDVGAPLLGAALSFVNLKSQAKTGYGDPEFYHKVCGLYYDPEQLSRPVPVA